MILCLRFCFGCTLDRGFNLATVILIFWVALLDCLYLVCCFWCLLGVYVLLLIDLVIRL